MWNVVVVWSPRGVQNASGVQMASKPLSRKSCVFIEDRVYHGTILKPLVLAGEKCEGIIAEKIRNVQVRDVEVRYGPS